LFEFFNVHKDNVAELKKYSAERSSPNAFQLVTSGCGDEAEANAIFSRFSGLSAQRIAQDTDDAWTFIAKDGNVTGCAVHLSKTTPLPTHVYLPWIVTAVKLRELADIVALYSDECTLHVVRAEEVERLGRNNMPTTLIGSHEVIGCVVHMPQDPMYDITKQLAVGVPRLSNTGKRGCVVGMQLDYNSAWS